MAENSLVRAEDQPWWPEFVSLYKKIPLRELARRFQTNSRRLRRAAQRSGLEEEPEALRENEQRLGTLPDASLADDLGVTPEMIQGARVRRNVPAFDPRRPRAKLARPARKPAPPPPKPIKPVRMRPDPSAVQVVVRRAPTTERRGELPQGVSLSRALANTPPPPPPSALPEPEPAAKVDPRRRVIRRAEPPEGGERRAAPTVIRRGGASLRDDRDDPESEPEVDSPPPPPADVPERPRRRIVSSERLEGMRVGKAPAPAVEEPPVAPTRGRRKISAPTAHVYTPDVPMVETLKHPLPRPQGVPRINASAPRQAGDRSGYEALRAAVQAIKPRRPIGAADPGRPVLSSLLPPSIDPRPSQPRPPVRPAASPPPPAVTAPRAPAAPGPVAALPAVQLWQALVANGDTQRLVIVAAPSLLEAATLVSGAGKVLSLHPAALL